MKAKLIERLIELAHRDYTCGDTCYNCPSYHSEGEGGCFCGLGEHNAEVDRIAKELKELIGE